MIEFLFLDLDDTILDFHKAERIALEKTFRAHGLNPAPEIMARYSALNKRCWGRLERGELTRAQVLFKRFETLFLELGMDVDSHAIQASYEENLSIGHYFLPGAEAAVKALSKKYRLFLASNGTAKVQEGRMTSAKLYPYFEQVFISEEIGFNKPAKAYFDACFARIPDFEKGKAMMVGDSLTSDIRGGNNAGLLTCWINPGHAPRNPEIHVDYEIEALSQLEALLSTLSVK